VSTFVRPPCDATVIAGTRAGECEPSPRATTGRWVLVATILGSSMVFIDGSVVNVALPTLQEDLGATAAATQWVVEAYALFLAALILVGGALGDRYGRQRIFLIGTAMFAVTSLLCGLAPNIESLIATRAAQGVAGALLTPASLALISAAYPDESARGRAIGTWSGFTSVTSAGGPVLGGWLVENLSWRWVFFINLPLAAAVLAITLTRVPESRDPAAGPLDWPGALLATVGLGALVYGLIEAPGAGWGNPRVIASLALGVLSLAGFLLVEARSPSPMMPLSLFRSRTFSGTNLLTFLLYAALGGALYFVPFQLIQVQGYSSTAAGAAFLPFVLLTSSLARWSGGLIGTFGARLPLVVGPLIAAAGFALFAVPGIGGSYWTTYFPAVVVLGLGMAVTVAPLTTAVMGAVDQRRVGLASGVNNAVARTASVLAIAVFGIIVAAAFDRALNDHLNELSLPPADRQAVEDQKDDLAAAKAPADLDAATQQEVNDAIDESFLSGFRLAMLIAAGMAVAGALAAGLMIEGKRPAPQAERAAAAAPG
jgi:EmrB/QacA subfamily drug resistance transporter